MLEDSEVLHLINTEYITTPISREEFLKKYEIKFSTFNRLQRKYKFKKDKQELYKLREQRRKESMILKYGVTTPYALESVQNNSRTEEANEKRKSTNLKKYGVENPLQSEEIKKKIKSTNLEKYGVLNVSQSEEIKKRIANTNNERYGAECVLQSGTSIRNDIENKWIEKYNKDNPLKNKDIQDKARKTREKNYIPKKKEDKVKSDYTLKNPDIHAMTIRKGRESIKRKYGVSHNSQIGKDPKIVDALADKKKFTKLIVENIPNYEDRTIENICKLTGYTYTPISMKLIEFDMLDVVNYKPHSSITSLHKSVENYIHNISDIYTERNNRSILKQSNSSKCLEMDIFIPDLSLGIETNGDYWHSSVKLKDNYHQEKSLIAKSNSIFVYNIWEHEWYNKQDIIKSQIKSLLGLSSNKIYARNCNIKEVSSKESAMFLNKNHLQGNRNSSIRIGLYYNDELVSLMTFGYNRFINKSCDSIELLRFCSKLDTNVVGGASKLFKYFIKMNHPDKVISYCDIAHGRGITYEKLGFKLDRITPPNYKWVNFKTGDIRSRYQCQVMNIRESENDKRTEVEIMTSRGYHKLCDCGNYKFIWSRI